MQTLTLVVLAGAIATVLIARVWSRFREMNGPRKVPGPLLLPYIGRIHDLPISFMWLKLDEWGKKHGGDRGFYYTEMLGAKFLVVTDEAIAEELLVKKAKNNSDRPVIRSLFDSKSTHGSGEYLPLMGRNREFYFLVSSRFLSVSLPFLFAVMPF